MKKIMIAACAVALATVAQAATVSWTLSGVQKDGKGLAAGHSYVFFANSQEAATAQIAAIVALAQSGATKLQDAMSSAAWNDTKKATAAGNFSIGTSQALGKYTLPTNGDLGLTGETTYYAYAVVFDTESITDASNFIVTQGGGATTTGFQTNADTASTNKSIALGNQSAATWYAVGGSVTPEPTSALLLLLGVAGLALKRKNA